MGKFAGFDRSDYPGDAVVHWLKTQTNLVWCGYYLAPTPSHGGSSWMGKRAALSAAGWGIAPIYVGQQVTGPGSHNPSAATGVADGSQAVNLMTSEGFAPGSYVYLDLENGPPMTQPLTDYVANWCDTVAAGGFGPGIYCSHFLALELHVLRTACRIWAFRVATTQPHPVPQPFPDPNPSGCGYIGAYAWQLGQSCIINVPVLNPPSLVVDLSTAITADPGAPDPVVAAAPVN
jgi:hypothetical protein